jgi:poly(3-hydroxybutyrate) depolymerase
VRARSFAAELIFFVSLSSAAVAADKLAGYGADASTFTVSGVSSGGNMAVQMHVAHSSRVTGVGALAAVPYYCAQGSLWTAMNHCMTPGAWTPLPRAESLREHADRFARERRIDPTQNLGSARIWLFSGSRDRTVQPAVVQGLSRFYALYKGSPVTVEKAAGHAMVTENAGNPCAATEPPFINDCDYDAAGELLRHVLGGLSPASTKPNGRLLAFDQNEFGRANAISMAEDGYLYVPRACDTERCRVHVAFHGCRQGIEGDVERVMRDSRANFIRDAGYNRWADTNRLIVLYPQVRARWALWTFNPRGCWDWWGYTDARYATREGAQISAVLAMIERLAEPRK